MKTMNCKQRRALFDERLDEQLANDARNNFDRHVAVCPACGPAWKDYTASWQVLARLPEIEPSVGFVERTLRRLDEQDQPGRVSWLLPVWRWALMGTASAVLVLSGLLLWQRAETQRAGALYAAVNSTDFVEDFDVIASLDLIQKQGRP